MKGKITAALFLGAVFFCIPVSAQAQEVLTYREFLNAAVDSYVTVEAYVQDKFVSYSGSGASLFAQNEDGGYFIYYAAMDEETYKALEPGIKIRVSGYKAEWSGETEIVDGQIEIIDDGDTFIAEPLDVSVWLGWDDMVYYQNSRVICTDVRIESSIDPDGNAVPFLYAWDGTGSKGDDLYFRGTCMGITYKFMVESDLCDADSETYQKVLEMETGDTFDLEGYLYYYDGDPLMQVTELTAGQDTAASVQKEIGGAAAAAGKAIEDSANEIEEEAGASGSSSSSGSKSSGSSSSGSSRKSSSSGSSSETDPYDAEEYDDPELFYDDHYLDFDSFEDAEVYWDDYQ